MKISLVTFQFDLTPEQHDRINASQDAVNEFTNEVLRNKDILHVTFGKYFGPWVWVSIDTEMYLSNSFHFVLTGIKETLDKYFRV